MSPNSVSAESVFSSSLNVCRKSKFNAFNVFSMSSKFSPIKSRVFLLNLLESQPSLKSKLIGLLSSSRDFSKQKSALSLSNNGIRMSD